MPDAMHPAHASRISSGHVLNAMHVRTNELTDADASKTESGSHVRNARDARRALSGLGGWESYDWASLPDGQKGPRRYCSAGWLYVVEFSFGVIKVGQSIAPRERLQQHVKEATRFGGSVSQFWLSPRHSQWMSNEGLLILWCYANGRQTFGEYFADLEFDKAVDYATALDYAPTGGSELPTNVIAGRFGGRAS